MFSGAKVKKTDTRDHRGMTQEDGSFDAALAWLSASMTANQRKKIERKKGRNKCVKKRRSTARP